MRPKVLYLSLTKVSPSHKRKLEGIRRYCESRGWEAVPVPCGDVSPAALPGLLAWHRPVGCVADGIGNNCDLLPGLFRGTPVVYIGYPDNKVRGFPNFHFDAEAIARMAFSELSAGMPPCYAVIGHPRPWEWSRNRVRVFRHVALSAGAQCRAFPAMPISRFETNDAFVARLVPWIAKLPKHCAVFAVSDETAVLSARAARAAMRHIPGSLTMLSVDNFTELCERSDPPISSIQLDLERQGFMAARALGEIISHCAAQRGNGKALRTSLATSHEVAGPLLVVRRKSTSGRGRHEAYILQAVEAIRREACNGLTAAALIARFPASKTNFNRRFREATGHSVLDEILHVRLEKACTLLAQTGTAIGAIPSLCGFNCDRTLDALFRSRFKMSMREWRKRNSQ